MNGLPQQAMHATRICQAILLCAVITACFGCGQPTPANADSVVGRNSGIVSSDEFRRTERAVTQASLFEAVDGTFTAGFNRRSQKGDLTELVELLSQFPELRDLRLYVSSDGLTREDYRQLARLWRVEDIHIETYAPVTGPELAPLTEMPNLKTLEFEEAWVYPGTLETLARSQSLEVFRVGSGYDLTDEARRLNVRFQILRTNNYEP